MLTQLRKMFYRARGHLDVTIAGEAFRVDPYHSKFWRRAARGQWEPETLAVLDRYLDRAHDYLDIGAWIGPTVLYGARKARHVWCFEPDPTAFRALSWNLDLNAVENVTALPAALSDKVGLTRMAGMHGEKGDSTTSLLNPAGGAGSDVITLDWDTVSTQVDLSGVSLVKIDVEGAEFDLMPHLLPWLKAQKPALLVSLHPPYLPQDNRARAVASLLDHLSGFAGCTDLDGKAVSREAALAAPALDRFSTLLFTP